MSSIRLFILSCFAEMGATHGHRLRLEAERRRIALWTDISVGAVYGAINRLAAEGLLRELGTETEGNRPPRQIYEITERGRAVLDALQHDALESVWFRYDPFDLALSRTALDTQTLRSHLSERRTALAELLKQRAKVTEDARSCVDRLQLWALRHSEYRLEAELKYLDDLLEALLPEGGK